MILYILLLSLAAVIFNLTLPIMAGLYIVSDLGGSPYMTSYTVSFFCIGNLLGVPLGKPAVTRLSPIQLFVVCLSLTALSSWGCATASDFFTFILFRFLEGFASGPMFVLITCTLIPLLSPNKDKVYIVSLVLICLSIIPVVGASYGAWIAYSYHWRFLFFSNIPLCIFLILYVGYGYRKYHEPVKKTYFDKLGYFYYCISMIFIGTALTTGQELDWFRSSLITFLLISGVISLIFFILRSWSAQHPVVDLKLLKNFYFSVAMIYIALFFALYFGMVILLSLWLKLYVNYTPDWIALIIGTMAFCGWIPVLINKKQYKPFYPLIIALLFFAISCFYTTYFNVDINFNRIAFSRALAGVGLALFLSPLFQLSVQSFPEAKLTECICFFHVSRLLGSGLGVSLFLILWHRREVFFHLRLGSSLTAFSPETQQFLERAKLFYIQGKHASAQLNFYLTRQATALALNDCFYLMGWMIISMLLFLIVIILFSSKKNLALTKKDKILDKGISEQRA
ncbi:MFS transporter [Legionella anisa]|uniref:MFS transporter n=1 Tax=Legionella anisa TaxID=28082 RepID=A0AAX0WUH1_9GAMM|nr:MFS transporter [Legionella anisa]AWN74061.1 MFS transporter [Legionella anisa]KTC74548.1 multidrug resistance protein, MFS superfamily [Legionella anisa]MCW8425919.1 MFS transporter [Legionella anisa]MCW8448649.1 MFS transporter [Legionella anisa]PNL62037.1 MFS transporter [Legionella anisa]